MLLLGIHYKSLKAQYLAINGVLFIYLFIYLFNYFHVYKAQDPVVEKLYQSTEEGQKVTRNKGIKLVAVFRRIQDPYPM